MRETIPINVGPFKGNVETPEDVKIRDVVKRLHNGSAGGVLGVWARHMKEWLRGVIAEEEHDMQGAGDE